MKLNNKIIIVVTSLLLIATFVIIHPNIVNKQEIEKMEYAWVIEYTTPNNDDIKTQTQSILGSTYNNYLTSREVYELQEWVAKNIKYEYEDPELPSDTLYDKTGSCFNMCSLLYSMILNEDSDSKSFILLIDVWIEGASDTFKHSAILTIFDEGIIISDPTVGFPAIESVSKLLSPRSAIDNIVDNTDVQHYVITHAVSLDEYFEFSNQEDFISFAEVRM